MRQSYALRACHVRCSRAPKPSLTSGLRVAAGGDRWLLTAVRGHAYWPTICPAAFSRPASSGTEPCGVSLSMKAGSC
jgi:hypothetical protein